MKKKLFRVTVLSVTIGLIVAFLLAMPMVLNIHIEEVQKSLKNTLLLVSNDFERLESDPEAFAAYYAALLSREKEPMRVTVMKEDGTVIGESEANAEEVENHLGRPEVAGAIKSEWGFDKRASSVVATSYYYAAYFHNGYIFRVAIPLQMVKQASVTLWSCAGLGIILGLVSALAMGQYISNKFVKPLNSLIKATRDVGSGDYTVRALPARDEVGELSQAFNIMTEKLYETHNELEINHDRLNSVLQGMDDGVIAVDADNNILILTARARDLLGATSATAHKISDCGANYLYIEKLLNRASDGNEPVNETIKIYKPDGNSSEEKLLQIYATPILGQRTGSTLAVISDVTRVRQLEQMRSEFVANVTHEIKTPLTSIRGYIELLKDGVSDEGTRSQFYDIIEIEAERLQNLIDDLLELSVIENGGKDTEQYRTSVASVAEKVVERLNPIADKKNVKIITSFDNTVFINASEGRLDQLLANLTDNAIKYNREGGEIRLSVRHERGRAVIRVRDNGIGIPNEHIDRIFERFYRVDKGRSRELGGTGLGLSIVKHIVGLYGGDISVKSGAEEGTEFVVRLPEAENQRNR